MEINQTIKFFFILCECRPTRVERNGNSNNGEELIFTLWINWIGCILNMFVFYGVYCRLRHSRIFSTKLEIFIQIYVSMCSNVLARLWIWWMTICCKITTNFMFRAGSHSARRWDIQTGERCLLYSEIVNGTFMLMNLIDHYGFGWQKPPKTIHVLLLPLLLPPLRSWISGLWMQ